MRDLLNLLRFRIDHRWTPPHASAYLDDGLAPPERRRLERHVEDCPECRELLRELRALITTLGTLRDEEGVLVAGAILSSVQGHLDEQPRERR